MKKLIIAALMATVLTGCVDNTSNGGLDDAPYNNSGNNNTDDRNSGSSNDGRWSADDDGLVDSDSDTDLF